MPLWLGKLRRRSRLGELDLTVTSHRRAGRQQDPPERWPDLDLEWRRAILGQIIDRIIIGATTRANNRFDPERVRIVWRV